MAQQEEGWPLGLQPLNLRIGLGRSRDGSTSFNTSLSDSLTSSTDSSSDLDTESTGSFFHDRSATLGSLIGVSSIVNLSRRSTRGRPNGVMTEVQKNYRSKTTWCFSLCPRNSTDAESTTTKMMIRNSDSSNAPSLGHFLAVERRAANHEHNRTSSPLIYGPDEFAMVLPNRDQNSLFANGQIAPPQFENRQRDNRELEHDAHGQGAPLLFPCMCG